jgi:uncharacterized damage-inducible protein DinB
VLPKMHPRLAELIEYAEAQRADLLAAVAIVPKSLREQRVAADSWSVAEVLEHLHRVEKGVARLLAHGLERARADGVGAELQTASVLGSLDRFRLTQRDRPFDAPEPVRPRRGLSSEQGLAALAESRRALLTALTAADGVALGDITYPHPILGSLNFYQWVLFVGQHEARHAAQIGEIARQLQDG